MPQTDTHRQIEVRQTYFKAKRRFCFGGQKIGARQEVL